MRGGFGGRISSGNEEEFSPQELDKKALKFIYKYLKVHIKTLFIATLSMFMVTLATLAGPFLSKIAIDNYIIAGDLKGLDLIFILMVKAVLSFMKMMEPVRIILKVNMPRLFLNLTRARMV